MTTLHLARNRLTDAISALCDPTWCDGHPLPSRYNQLRVSLHDRHNSRARTPPQSVIPAAIDHLMLAIRIDERAAAITTRWTPDAATPAARQRTFGDNPTPAMLQFISTLKHRPQDTRLLNHISTEIDSWTKAIDDLMAARPLFLPNPCPQCGKTHAYRLQDDGEHARTQGALTLTTDKAECLNCHTTWAPKNFGILARMLGYQPLRGELTCL